MDFSQFAAVAVGQFGPLGLLLAYLVWRESLERKDRREQAAIQAQLAKEDFASRLDLSKSLTMLSMVVQGKANV